MDARLTALGFILVFAGLLLVIVGLISEAWSRGGKVEGGAVIIIGPFPIVIGSSPGAAKILTILGVVLTIVVVAAYLILFKSTGINRFL